MVSRYLNLGPFIYVCLLPLIIFMIPLTTRTSGVMTISFLTALLFDFLGDGILGLNAAAAVMTAALRKPLLKIIVRMDRQDRTDFLTINQIGPGKYLKFLASLTAVYMAAYISLDCISFRPFGFFLIRLVASIAVTLPISFLLSFSFIERR